MFMRCTQLDAIAAGIEACKENIKANEDTLNDINRMLPERKAERDKWTAEYAASEQLGKLEEQVHELKGQYAWAVVQDKESVRVSLRGMSCPLLTVSFGDRLPMRLTKTQTRYAKR